MEEKGIIKIKLFFLLFTLICLSFRILITLLVIIFQIHYL